MKIKKNLAISLVACGIIALSAFAFDAYSQEETLGNCLFLAGTLVADFALCVFLANFSCEAKA